MLREQEKLKPAELAQLDPEEAVRARAFVMCSDCGEPIESETLGTMQGGSRWVHAKHLQEAKRKPIGAAIV